MSDLELYVDRGGTFTDCALRQGDRVVACKVPSTDDAPIVALRGLLGWSEGELPAVRLVVATTLGTNALLERRGSRVLLITDEGLEDLLRIGDQARPDLFAQRPAKKPPLTDNVLGVPLAIDAAGRTSGVLDEDAFRERVRSFRSTCDVAAIALRFAPLAPDTERNLGALAREAGFTDVILSHEVVPAPGFLARLETSVVDAYLTPVMQRYLDHLAGALPGSTIEVMRSDGTLAPSKCFRGRDAALSGPAGGLVAVARLLASRGLDRGIAFDVGGTSTDVALVVSRLSTMAEGVVDGLRIRAPMLPVHTVAAGGGSVCRIDDDRLVVGPTSVGASPGPLCYGRPDARDVALTDVAVVLGRLVAEGFPIPLALDRSRDGVRALATANGREPEALALDLFDVAIATTAQAVREVTVREGVDPRDLPLVAYGGAGGQYACALARALGIREVLFPPRLGVFSAIGVGSAERGERRERRIVAPTFGEAVARAGELEPELVADVERALHADDGHAPVQLERALRVRYVGTDTVLDVPFERAADAVRTAFEAEHLRVFGSRRSERAVECVGLVVRGTLASLPLPLYVGRPATATREVAFVDRSGARTIPVRGRGEIAGSVVGPLLIVDEGATLVVDEGFVVEADATGVLVARDTRALAPADEDSSLDPVRLEVFAGAFMAVARRMGEVLRRTAQSPNIRDRLDFSCALFDRRGGLVANAPHIPVHLGAMGESVRSVLRAFDGDLAEGDAFLTNHPSHGGSHLPDVTLVRPIVVDGELLAFVACRGHHPDVGGIVPGSMPAESSRLDEEGVPIAPMRVAVHGELDADGVRVAFTATALPARRPDENVAEVRAQHAALEVGAASLRALVDASSPRTVSAYFEHLASLSERAVRRAIREAAIEDGRCAEDALDDGTRIRCTLHPRDDGGLVLDFSGTSPAHPGNANAPRAVVRSAVLYVLRLLANRELPLNEGFLRCVTLAIPRGSLLDPPPDAAVSSGNVETSQRIVDVLVRAFGLGADSQGTMNNVTLGGEGFSYYETLGGGAGATVEGPGASCVHTHMTNSRLTDVEVLEESFPVKVRATRVRRGSGGVGRHAGGDGMVREIVVLRPAEVAFVTERRVLAPRGAAGGGNGACGRNFVDGVEIGGRVRVDLEAGAVLRVETPGGGAFGTPN